MAAPAVAVAPGQLVGHMAGAGDLGASALDGIAWVTLERLTRERADTIPGGRDRPYRADAERLSDEELLGKLRAFGIDLDRPMLEALCRDALSAQEVAVRLMDLSATDPHLQQSDWIWLSVLTLWQRWLPDQLCMETIDDQMQDGYATSGQDLGAATDLWLQAWSGVLQLCDAAGITTIAGFDAQFPLTQSLFNWNQDLEMELGNAGLADPAKLQARLAVGAELARRFTDVNPLTTQNWRRAIAESWFWLGETATADQMYRDWLDADPQWGYGWIGWADGHLPPARTGAPIDRRRAEELLQQGYAVPGVRDRDAIAEWLEQTRKDREASE
ncbi:MAG TPA: hypothetical protein VHN80_17075 [Kineosporiaceae bacterium]|nr:hypothetical protein [Kineosporiaceae bacterium]